ncbi:MAG: hypothetical protein IJ171_07770 [Ruminococcus sp.]|nr:hypothetical protein [Ruminococcus sp.]
MRVTDSHFENMVINTLLQMDYPNDSIATEWRNNNHVYDIIVIDTTTHLPLMIIECKTRLNPNSLNNVYYQLKRYDSDYDYPVRLCAAIYRDETGFDFYDFTRKIYNNDTDLEDILTTEVPTYQFLKLGFSSKREKAQNTKRKKYINGLKIACWGIIPMLIATVIFLDAFNIYPATTERLFIYGALLLSILLPFFGEIKIGEVSLLQKNKRKEEQEHKDA